MTHPPESLDGARVLAFADLTDVSATGTVRHFRDGALQPSDEFAYLALAAYERDTGVYAFYCDNQWEVLNDRLFDSRSDAEAQLSREFQGIAFTDV